MSNTTLADKSTGQRMSSVRAFLKSYLAVEERRQRRRLADSYTLNEHTKKDIGLQQIDIWSAATAAHWGRKQ